MVREKGEVVLINDVSEAEEQDSLLETVFEDGKLIKTTTLQEIRAMVDSQI